MPQSTLSLDAEIPEQSHFVRFYAQDDLLLAEVGEFLQRALCSGGTAVAIATPEHTAQLIHELERLQKNSSVKNQHRGGKTHRLITLDAERTLSQFLVDGWPDRERFHQVVGHVVAQAADRGGSIHAFGEMVALLCAQGKYDAAIHLEALWNELASRHVFRLFCAYPTHLFASSDQVLAFQKICGAHNHICTSEHISAPAKPEDIRLLVATWEQKASALEAEIARRQKTEEQLRETSRAKDEFLAMLGHELRNPLAPIVTALQLMRMRGDTGTEREQAIIQRQVDHLVQLIADLLDISKVTRGMIDLHKEWISIATVLTKAVEMVSPLFEQRSHRLIVDAAEQLYVNGDAVRLAQIVSNLLSNAARYTPIGGEIHLTARRDEWEHIVISVRDNGIGIATEMLPKIFDLFFQGARDGGRSEGGLGIGLALVKSFVELHGGSASVHSDGLGLGSEFRVRLPLALGDDAPEISAHSIAAIKQFDERVALKILVVDDNVDAAETLARFLSGVGHEVQVVNSPTTALLEARTFLPDLAILDIGLPVMDGYELAAQLQRKSEWDNCKFVALTGYGQDVDRERSKVAGFKKHFVKPIDPQELLRFVREVGAAHIGVTHH